MAKLKIKYYTESISRIPPQKAKVYGEELTRLIKQKGGQLTSDDIVISARLKSSPLHDYFEWDNATAAYEHRKEQARYLLRHIKISVNGSDKHDIRAFYSVLIKAQGGRKPQHVFITVEDAMKTEEYREQIIARLWNSAENWAKRARQFDEFTEIVNAIDRESLNN